jgi:poly(hydroxyalkanoate) depolymerase family esterase
MSGFGNAMAQIQSLRRKFEGLLDTARESAGSQTAPMQQAGRLQELTGFGLNPGNLRMWAYVPERLPRGAPLVVALHGCSQSADEYDHGAGWSVLADRLGFAVVYPEQQSANNPKNCFSWFLPGDTARDHGEALSIQQMIAHAIAMFGVDRSKVFVTGLSAGGAMASVMLASYPEVFAGGAIIAGLPYGCARSVQQAFEVMFTEQSHSARALGDRVRAASRHQGPWPKISVWHGSADPIVKPSNAEEIVRQWSDVHGLATAPSNQELIGNHTRRAWHAANGDTLIEMITVNGMAHGVPLALTTDERSCGAAGPFFLEAGISSTRRIADFWGLGEASVETSLAPSAAPEQVRSGGRAIALAATAGARNDAGDLVEADVKRTRRAPDPSAVIAAALTAAGLPIANLANAPPGTKQKFAPGQIIEAALKAARLTRT